MLFNYIFWNINETHKQYSLLYIFCQYVFFADLQEHIYTEEPKGYYMSPGEAGRHVVGFLDLFIDVFLGVQSKR